jgi:copper chaperone CopZ
MGCRSAVFALVVVACGFTLGCQDRAASPGPVPGEASGKSKQVTVAVEGMTCDKGCPPRVRDALETLPWASEVRVSFEKKQATFVADAARYDEGEVVRVLTEEGFQARVVK